MRASVPPVGAPQAEAGNGRPAAPARAAHSRRLRVRAGPRLGIVLSSLCTILVLIVLS